MEVAITAIGTAVPAYKRSQQQTAELIASFVNLSPLERRLLKSVYRATGIDYRHSVLKDYCMQPGQFDFFPNDPDGAFPSTAIRMQVYQDNALALAVNAIDECLSNFDKSTITHVVTVSCTGMYAPGLDIEIVHQYKLNPNVKRTAINFMGCYGAFNALKVAEAACIADPRAKVLLVSVELCTIHFQQDMKLDNMVANAIFADGAAAILIESVVQQTKYLTLSAFQCDLLPQTSAAMAWKIADTGFDIVLSSYVPEAIETGIARFTENLMQQTKLLLTDIDFYAIHPGGLKILQACEASLQMTAEQNKYSYHVLKNFGNMSSATVIFVLKAIWDDLTLYDHDKNIFSCAFGPGLTLESMLLKVNNVSIT